MSASWPHFFEGVHQTSGEPRVCCKFCHGDLMHPALSGPSTIMSMTRHLKECHNFKKAQRSGSLSNAQFFKKRETKQEITQSYVNDEVLKFFISGNIPFNQIENKEFKHLLSLIQMDGHPYDPPSRKVLP